jgi:multiple sugar transport system substrate-binding protein
MEQWYLNVLAQNSPDVKISAHPFVDKNGQPLTWEDGDAYAVVNGTKNPDAACEFVHVMTSAANWINAAQKRASDATAANKPQTGVYSGDKIADQVIFGSGSGGLVNLDGLPVFQKPVKVYVDGQATAFGTAPSPASAEFQTAWTNAINSVLTSGADPASALKDAQSTAQSAIDQAKGQ